MTNSEVAPLASVQITDLERGVITGPVLAYGKQGTIKFEQAQAAIETQIGLTYHVMPEIAGAVMQAASGVYDEARLREELRLSNADTLPLTGTQEDAIRSLVAMAAFAGYVAGYQDRETDNSKIIDPEIIDEDTASNSEGEKS